MKLEEQLSILGGLGLTLNEGVTIDDLLYSWDRTEYERKPFDMILFQLGIEIEREPWGRYVSDCAWNLDMECIEGPGSYVHIVENLARIANARERVTEISDDVDIEKQAAWVSYKVDGKETRMDAKVQDDWADPNVIINIISDLEQPGFRFYAIDNGQANIWYYLEEDSAKKLNELSNGALSNNRR